MRISLSNEICKWTPEGQKSISCSVFVTRTWESDCVCLCARHQPAERLIKDWLRACRTPTSLSWSVQLHWPKLVPLAVRQTSRESVVVPGVCTADQPCMPDVIQKSTSISPRPRDRPGTRQLHPGVRNTRTPGSRIDGLYTPGADIRILHRMSVSQTVMPNDI